MLGTGKPQIKGLPLNQRLAPKTGAVNVRSLPVFLGYSWESIPSNLRPLNLIGVDVIIRCIRMASGARSSQMTNLTMFTQQ